MRTSILVLAIVFSLSSFQSASAVPKALYNPTTGNVQFVIDFDYYGAVSLISPSGSLTNSNELIDIPGAASDDLEFPFAYTYLGLKSGTWNTGNTVVPNTPANDLILQYRLSIISTPVQRGEIIVIPEPAALTAGMVGVVALLRRRRR